MGNIGKQMVIFDPWSEEILNEKRSLVHGVL